MYAQTTDTKAKPNNGVNNFDKLSNLPLSHILIVDLIAISNYSLWLCIDITFPSVSETKK
jgi:hypothetical protein